MIAENEYQEPDKSPNDRIYSFDEVLSGLQALDKTDLKRLANIGRGLAAIAGMDSDDLQNEAFVRMLESRTCSTNVDIMGFAIGTMKSIASTAYRREKKEQADGTTSVPIAANDGGVDPADDAVSPEQEALSRVFFGESLGRVDAAIADDDELQLLVMGLCDGLIGKKLEELLGTDTKGLAAARKRLAKRLQKAFPEGSPVRSKD